MKKLSRFTTLKLLDSRFVFSNSEPAHVSKSFRFPDFALIIEAEPSEKFHCETINTKKTKTTSTSDSNRHKKSKPFHLVGDHLFFLVPKILMEWTKSRFAKHPRVSKIRRNLTPNQFFGSDVKSHYVDFCQLLPIGKKRSHKIHLSANDAFQKTTTSARRFRSFRSTCNPGPRNSHASRACATCIQTPYHSRWPQIKRPQSPGRFSPIFRRPTTESLI